MTDEIEASVEKHLDREVRRMGGETRKVRWVGRRGAPDRAVLLPGIKLAYVELKRPKGGLLEAHQQREHDRLRACGVEVAVLYTRPAVDAWLREARPGYGVLWGAAAAFPHLVRPA